MSKHQQVKTRLGDLLVERGLITQDQLLEAMQEQQTSHLQLGEILVSKGWVSKRHVRKTLRVQSKLRNVILTSILSFSPVVMVGCGGGGGASGGQNQSGSSAPAAEQQATQSDIESQVQNAPETSLPTIAADNDSTIHLSWDYPVERMDGSDLELYEIDGFRIYQLDANGDVGAVHVIEGLETEYDVTGLDDGEYHFAVTVVDSDGMESDLSEVITVSVI